MLSSALEDSKRASTHALVGGCGEALVMKEHPFLTSSVALSDRLVQEAEESRLTVASLLFTDVYTRAWPSFSISMYADHQDSFPTLMSRGNRQWPRA